MKHFYRLLNYEFGNLLSRVLLICAGLIVSTIVFIQLELRNYTAFSEHQRYEKLYSTASGPIIFLISYILLMFVFFLSLRAPYTGGKSIYTFLTLPIKRECLYFSKITAFLISLLLLFCSQLISYVIGYKLMVQHISSYGDGQFIMHNGFFLSFIRSDFMRMLWPFSPLGWLSTICIIMVSITIVYFIHLSILKTTLLRSIPILFIYYLLFQFVKLQLNTEIDYKEETIVIPSILLIFMSLVFMIESIRLLRKGDIA